MPKRRRSTEDDWNEMSDASTTPKGKKNRVRGREHPPQNNASTASSSPHSRSVHIIQMPVPMRAALLKWFQTVHTNRGMPWRKPYNPNLGIKDRSQRAYEVPNSITC